MVDFSPRSGVIVPDIPEKQHIRASSNIMCYLLGDTSINKASFNKTRADRLIEAVTNKETMLLSQKEVRNITQNRRKVQEN